MPTTVPGIDALSERQKEVLRLTARHHQVKEIAHLLKISENTVKTHLIETRRRLGGVTTKQAVRLLLAQEEGAGLILEGGYRKEVIPSAGEAMPVWLHEQALYPTTTPQRNHDDQFPGSGNSLADAGLAGQAPAYRGRDRNPEDAQPDSRSGKGDLQYGRYRGVSYGRWDEFRGGLKDLPAIQLLGLIALAAFALALIAGMLAGTLLGMAEAVHKLTIYAGWKS
ncbi:MAG: helix-turn-helix transcriptional regulator [Asticcacaulis sp.]|nr:helix-turn-helix transcriptional regulator [Asticcacaulis sp.]